MGARYPDLAGRTVFVSGGASGIGAAFVRAFGAQDAKVAFVDIDDAAGRALADDLGASVRYIHCDVRDVASLRDAIGAASDALGTVRVLINNAARDDRRADADVTPEYWDDMLAVNLRHHFFAAQAVAPAMARAGGGAIINMGSVSWMRGRTGMSAYTTSKAAIMGLTRTLARALGADGIRVNCIVPGAIATERQKQWFTAEQEREFLALQCLQFRVSVDDVARTALFLASEEARAVTGHGLLVDAGLAQTSAAS